MKQQQQTPTIAKKPKPEVEMNCAVRLFRTKIWIYLNILHIHSFIHLLPEYLLY